ncbi:hypothetical protein BT69DRAFT_1279600 [Atractiella rhizophila]|nr:hypothetical protein BT69DRAFT_1279600 [Atractiella rhizophila]
MATQPQPQFRPQSTHQEPASSTTFSTPTTSRDNVEESLVIFAPTISSHSVGTSHPRTDISGSAKQSPPDLQVGDEDGTPTPSAGGSTPSDWSVVLPGPSNPHARGRNAQLMLETSLPRHDGTGTFNAQAEDRERDEPPSLYASAISISPSLTASSVDSGSNLISSAQLESIESETGDGSESWAGESASLDSASASDLPPLLYQQRRPRGSRHSLSSVPVGTKQSSPEGGAGAALGESWAMEESGLESVHSQSDASSPSRRIEVPVRGKAKKRSRRPLYRRASITSSSQAHGHAHAYSRGRAHSHPRSRLSSVGSNLPLIERVVNLIFSLERETLELIEQEIQRPYSSYAFKRPYPSPSPLSFSSEGEKHGFMRVAKESRIELGNNEAWRREEYGSDTEVESLIGSLAKKKDGSRTPRVMVTPVIERIESAKVEEKLEEPENGGLRKNRSTQFGVGDMVSRVVGRWSEGWNEADFGASRS